MYEVKFETGNLVRYNKRGAKNFPLRRRDIGVVLGLATPCIVDGLFYRVYWSVACLSRKEYIDFLEPINEELRI